MNPQRGFQKGNIPWGFRKDINTNEIIRLYYDLELSLKEIAQRFNCSWDLPFERLKKAGYKLRTSRESHQLALKTGRQKPPSGKNHYRWNGGRMKHSDGYIMLNINGKRIREHVLIWERVHNQKLLKGYVIHHLNGIRDDNRPENLVSMKLGEHSNLAEPYKQKIRQLEQKVKYLRSLCDI